MFLLPVLITIILCVLIYYLVVRNITYWKKRNIQGPKPVLFFGNIIESALRRQPIGLIMKKIYNDYPDEKVVGVYRMKTPCYLIRDPDLIKHITIKDFDNFVDRGVEFSKKDLGVNLFHADGESWRVLRNRLTPIFTSGKLKNMLYLIDKRGDLFMSHFQKLIETKPEQDIKTLIQKYTISSIAATAFGLDVEYDNNKIFEQLEELDTLIFTSYFTEELDMMFPGILKIIGGSVFPKSVTTFFKNLVQSVIKERNGKSAGRNDFMDLMLAMHQEGVVKRKSDKSETTLEVTESVMVAQAFVFYAAGYETSATTMSFMMYQLALNPDVQQRLIAHIDEVLARHGGQLSYECLTDLTYLELIFQETLRMYPIVDPLQRNAINDYKFPGTDIVIKKGQTILLPVNGLHYDEKYYPNPEKFEPERFTPENSRNRHPCVYLPFGIGPRNCIGSRFAQVQSKIFIAKFFTKYQVEVSQNTMIPLKYDGTKRLLSSAGGIPLKIVPRTRN